MRPNLVEVKPHRGSSSRRMIQMKVAQQISVTDAFRNLSMARTDFRECFTQLSSRLAGAIVSGETNSDNPAGQLPPGLRSGRFYLGQVLDVTS